MSNQLPSNIRYDPVNKTYFFASENTPEKYSVPELFRKPIQKKSEEEEEAQ